MQSFFQIRTLLNNRTTDENPSDDFRIVDSWAEYDDSSSKSPNERPLKYMCYELETVDPETGRVTRFYKALKFVRVIRIPASARQSTTLMDMQENILSAVYETNGHLITVIANIIEPVAIGLLYLYGVQGRASNMDDARTIADHDYKVLVNTLQAQFRVIELRAIMAEESEWLRSKLYGMNHMTVIRGIPKANKAGEDIGNKGVGNKNVNPDSEGTLEAIIAGMSDYEYVLEVISSPVRMETLAGWQQENEKNMTYWNSQLKGAFSYSLSMSIPAMFGTVNAQTAGWSKGYNAGRTTGISKGESFSRASGQSVGESLSQSFGRTVGQTSGTNVSNSYNNSLSRSRSLSVGESFGESQGISRNVTNGTSFTRTYNTNIGRRGCKRYWIPIISLI